MNYAVGIKFNNKGKIYYFSSNCNKGVINVFFGRETGSCEKTGIGVEKSYFSEGIGHWRIGYRYFVGLVRDWTMVGHRYFWMRWESRGGLGWQSLSLKKKAVGDGEGKNRSW